MMIRTLSIIEKYLPGNVDPLSPYLTLPLTPDSRTLSGWEPPSTSHPGPPHRQDTTNTVSLSDAETQPGKEMV